MNKNFFILSLILTIICSCLISNVIAQEIDSTTTLFSDTVATESVVVKRHSPGKAALLSAVLPGAGQVYNKKYWKLPIVYGGLAGLSFWLGRNVKNLNGYKDALVLHYDDDPNTLGSYRGISDPDQLQIEREAARKNVDLSAVILAAFYSIQIIDAAVDAHLYEYDVTEDISVAIDPKMQMYQAQNGSLQPVGALSLTLNFK